MKIHNFNIDRERKSGFCQCKEDTGFKIKYEDRLVLVSAVTDDEIIMIHERAPKNIKRLITSIFPKLFAALFKASISEIK